MRLIARATITTAHLVEFPSEATEWLRKQHREFLQFVRDDGIPLPEPIVFCKSALAAVRLAKQWQRHVIRKELGSAFTS